MKTKLIEFLGGEKQKLRGILTLPDGEIKMGVICLHGFERCSATEKKFKKLADAFAENMIATFRFDFSGCGLSDGDFKFTTIERQGLEFLHAINVFWEEIGNKKISIVAHSLGACVLATQIKELKNKIEKIILVAPALNQKDLLRYWFAISQMKKFNPTLEVTWKNYKDYFNEKDFIKDCEKEGKTTKANYINPEYFLTGKEINFSNNFDDESLQILHIHGDTDAAVPIDSLSVKFKNQILVEGGDHDLEKPKQLEQWLQKSVDFVSSENQNDETMDQEVSVLTKNKRSLLNYFSGHDCVIIIAKRNILR
ncbi:MAG: hypothetical protein ACD_7C00443G0004 [uncultured bacterium]|nr:MAG: hypothetical protein ACD_7C00443G0004 [uncultured bacterium]HBR79404.1 hypothetical protein [Candidatus Moranbacteria bacterium]